MLIRRAALVLVLLGASAAAAGQPGDRPAEGAKPAATKQDSEAGKGAPSVMAGTLRMVQAAKLKNAVAYLEARIGVLERIAKEYPRHADKARAAAAAYRRAFGPGRDAMVKELGERDAAAGKAVADFLANDIPKMVREAPLTEELVDRGTTEGLFDPRLQRVVHVPWLLAYTPAYVGKPEQEFADGWVRTETIGVPTLTGRVLTASIPISWATLNSKGSTAPEQPYFAATAGVGPAMLLVQGQVQPELKAGDRAWLEEFLKGALQSQAPGNVVASAVENAATGELAASITMVARRESGGKPIAMLMKMWFIPREGVLLLCTEQVYDPDPATSGGRSRGELEAVKGRYQPLLDAMIKSVKVESAPGGAK